MVGVSKVHDWDEWPNWPISVECCREAEYSPKLIIEIPAGNFDLIWYKNGKKVEG